MSEQAAAKVDATPAPAPETNPQAAPAPAQAAPASKEPNNNPAPTEQKFELKLPEGSILKPDHVEKISAFAKEKGLSPEVAQTLLERENAAVSDYVNEQKQSFEATTEQWVDELKNDKEFGGAKFETNVKTAQLAVKQFCSPEFQKILNDTGFGNHPELVKTFAKIGTAMASDKFVTSGVPASKPPKSTAEIMYPTTAQKKG